MNLVEITKGIWAHQVTPENISQALAITFAPNDITLIGENQDVKVIPIEDFKERFRPVFDPQRYMDAADDIQHSAAQKFRNKEIDLNEWVSISEQTTAHQNLVGLFLPFGLVDKNQ